MLLKNGARAASATTAAVLLLAPAAWGSPGGDSNPFAQRTSTAAPQSPQQKADALKAKAAEQRANVAEATKTLQATAASATAALQAYGEAQRNQMQAQLDRIKAEQQLDAARKLADTKRTELGTWVNDAYQHGNSVDSPALTVLLDGGSSQDLTADMHILSLVGSERSQALQELQAAEQAQQQASAAAQSAATAADAAAGKAQETKAAKDAAVATQRQALADLQTQLSTTTSAADKAQAEATRLAQAQLMAQQASAALPAGGNAVTGAVGTCKGGDVSLYANGFIPIEALCPLWGTKGDYLRADAAHAFNQLSQAYAKQFSTPLCVTDSYRPYSEQVAVAKQNARMAATPGRSHHGWGIAVDFCGGIEKFGTPTHEWMKLNAPAFGWYHPSWAQPTGSTPEAWHWEYGG